VKGSRELPGWAQWTDSDAYTLGVEEEVMLLDPSDWSLAQEVERVLDALHPELARRVESETHRCVVELGTGVHRDVAGAAGESEQLREALTRDLQPLELRAACAGTHPFAVWQDTVVSNGRRYRFLYGSMRELARREPTFALHVHVGVPDAESAIRLLNRMRTHLPLLLALSANSPFWQGRDTGLASARTPLFQAFPRVGAPRMFRDYADWVETVDLMLRCEAFPEPTFLWWDVRPQPRFGTVEVRIMDVQTSPADTAALVALVQSLARLELEEGYASPEAMSRQELLEENRFLAARDGPDARLIDARQERRVPVRVQVRDLLDACGPHAAALGCETELAQIERLAERGGAERQVVRARADDRLAGLVETLADAFCERPAPEPASGDASLAAVQP
jgi:glutamate---cysteine ligase / carboxylate-amine ligase